MCTINLTWEEIKAAMRLDDVLGVKTALESCYREPPMPPNQRATALGYFITMAISGTHYDRDPAQNSERAIRFGITHHEALELDLQTFVDFVAYDVLKYPELSILKRVGSSLGGSRQGRSMEGSLWSGQDRAQVSIQPRRMNP